MKSALFYFSEKPKEGRQPVQLPDGQTVYIRALLGHRIDALSLLDHASPDEDETVLNSVEVKS